MKQFFSKRTHLRSAVLVAAAALFACNNDSTSPTPVAAAIAPSSSPPATALVATAVAGPSVLVTNSAGTPIEGVVVNFDVTAGGGALQYSTATSDAQGIASAGLWQIGPKVGANTATATVEGVAPVTFTVASQPGPASKVSPNSGNGVQAAQGATIPLSARVTDAGGNVKSGSDVSFTVLAGGGSIAAPTTATSDAQGIATPGPWTYGKCRAQIVRGDLGSLSTLFQGTTTGQPTIAVGGTAAGTLDASDCQINGAPADEYDLTTAAGAVNISMTSAAAGAALLVQSADATAVIASNGSTPPALRLITAAGPKTVAATAAAGATGAYSISVASTSSAVTDCTPVFLEIGASTDQTLSTTDCQSNFSPASGDWSNSSVSGDAYTVFIPAGTTVRISQTAVPLDALIAFYGPTGSLITYRDNGGVGASGTEVINFTSPTSGFYKIVAGSYCLLFDDPYQAGCDYGAYTLTVIKP
jgi:hypothetical protein